MPGAYTRIDFHSIGFFLVLADVGIAMEKARKAHWPNVLANIFKGALCEVCLAANVFDIAGA